MIFAIIVAFCISVSPNRTKAQFEHNLQPNWTVDPADFVPSEVFPLENPRADIPRIARDPTLTQLIDAAVQKIPTSHTLNLCDARAMGELAPASVHLVLTSRPYWTLTMEKVGWELTRDVESLGHLFDMLNEALISCRMTIRMTRGGIGVGGHYFSVHSTECWAGLYYAQKPDVVVFEAYDIDKEAAPAVSIGHFKEQGRNTVKWVDELELSSESVHFFALSKERQQESLERFLGECIETVRKIRGGQAPTVAS